VISHHHRTIFVHIPKCGGQSVEQAFLDDLGLTWAQRAPLVLGRNLPGGAGPPRLAHLSAADYTRHHFVTPEMWRDYFTFAVVRDPVARAMSLFNHLAPVATLDAFVHDWLPEQFALAPAYEASKHGNPGKYHFVRPQTDFVTTAEGAILPDRIIRLEDLATVWPEVQSNARFAASLPHRNASGSGVTTRDLSQRGVDAIAALYQRDFETFGYDPGVRRPTTRMHPFRRVFTRLSRGS
tara:strand:+ start:3905 stop:4618 length:714 start_codon:yes stop_codon:yes gene_type:complete